MTLALEGATPLLTVFDVPTSIAFYRDVLGFDVVETSKPFTNRKDDFGWVLLRSSSVELMLNNAYEDNIRPSTPDEARIDAHFDTVIYFICRDVDGAYAYLRERKVLPTAPKISYYGMKQMYLTDPDGYRLCFQWPVQVIR